MSQSEKPVSKPFAQGTTPEGAGKKTGRAKRPSPVMTVESLQARYQKGVSRVGTQAQLESLPLSQATSLSALLHVVGPILLTVLTMALLWLLSWLLNFNFWDLFQSHQKPDLEFTLVQDTKATRPDNPKFKGNFNQRAGGTPQKSQPLKAMDEPPQAAAKKSEPPKPQQPTLKPEPTPRKEQPKPVAQQPPAQEKTAEKPAVIPTIKKPSQETPAQANTTNPTTTALAAQSATTGTSSQAASQGTQFTGSSSNSSSMGNPQAGNSPNPGVDVAQDVDFGPFMADLERRIKRNWVPPRGSESRKVVLMLFIARDGNVIKIDVKKSSGDTEADESAKQAVVASLPFLALPPQFKEDILPVEFAFDYNVLNPKNPKQALKW